MGEHRTVFPDWVNMLAKCEDAEVPFGSERIIEDGGDASNNQYLLKPFNSHKQRVCPLKRVVDDVERGGVCIGPGRGTL